jgi:hypothetical protein
MNFKTKKIATAVAVGLGASVVGMSAAQADEILFPYVVVSDTVTTVLSVVNDADDLDGTSVDELHYRYYYKTGAAAESKTSTCSEVNVRRPSSPNDLVTFDVGGVVGAETNHVLFEPADRQENARYLGPADNFASLRTVKPARAFAVVDNNDFLTPTAANVEESMYGEALIIELGSGAAWGYRAYNPAGIYVDNPPVITRITAYDFSDKLETEGEVLANSDTPVVFHPFSELGGEFKNRLFVTPVSTDQLRGDLTATIRFAVDDPTVSTLDVMYDRDENPVSGQIQMKVTCVAGVDAATMITSAALNELPFGGWTNLVSSASGGDETNQVIAIKLEYNETIETINGEPVDFPGSFNNSLWLRKGFRESVPGDLIGVWRIPEVNDMNSPCPLLSSASDYPEVCRF